MTMEPIAVVCDVCGQPAVEACIDIQRVDDGAGAWKEYAPIPGIRRVRCAEHRAPSRSFDQNGNEERV